MAPSRALFRCIYSASPQPHTETAQYMPRLARSLSTSVVRFQRLPVRPSAQHQMPFHPRSPAPPTRLYSQQAPPGPSAPDHLNAAELDIFNKIKGALDPVKLEVQDISGGCGSMYAIEIESPRFAGLTVIKQHKLVNQVLKEEIAMWHGVKLRTRAS